MKKILFLPLILWLVSSCNSSDELVVYSPDKHITFNVKTDETLSYSVRYNFKELLDRSDIGFSFRNAPYLGKDVEVVNISTREVDETWTPVLKRYDSIRNHYNEMIIELREKKFPGRKFNLEALAYNDGVAFRIHFLPADQTFLNTIMDEHTEFRFVNDPDCWAVDYKSFDSHQESEFVKMKVSDLTNEMYTGLPLTLRFKEKLYGAITEADLTNYAGMYLTPLEKDEQNGVEVQLAPRDGEERAGAKVLFKGTHQTPWRVLMLSETPGGLIESEIIQNLNEPCAMEDTDWIKPGVSAWDHWWSGEVKMEQEVILDYIDLAAEMKWEYMLIDWQWYGQFNLPEADITRPAPQLNMQEILEYAKSKDVRCWLWLYWTDVDKADFDAACQLYHDWGIAGVKIDFMARDDQEMVNWYHKIVKTAADHQLMVDFHGAYKPTGWRRTYPNLVTREGVMGNEYNKWSYRVTPDHNCTLPFTRMLAGPMDFTPGGFLNCNPDQFRTGVPARVQGTRAQTLAQFVVYDSPFLVACDHPDHYKGQAGSEFIADISSVWDDTKVLNGEIGEYITMARKTHDTWYIGAMTNSNGRSLSIKLDFLDENTKYELLGFEDSEQTEMDAAVVEKVETMVSRNDMVQIDMVPGGGYAARIKPVGSDTSL